VCIVSSREVRALCARIYVYTAYVSCNTSGEREEATENRNGKLSRNDIARAISASGGRKRTRLPPKDETSGATRSPALGGGVSTERRGRCTFPRDSPEVNFPAAIVIRICRDRALITAVICSSATTRPISVAFHHRTTIGEKDLRGRCRSSHDDDWDVPIRKYFERRPGASYFLEFSCETSRFLVVFFLSTTHESSYLPRWTLTG